LLTICNNPLILYAHALPSAERNESAIRSKKDDTNDPMPASVNYSEDLMKTTGLARYNASYKNEGKPEQDIAVGEISNWRNYERSLSQI
jgi:hypothetical protein